MKSPRHSFIYRYMYTQPLPGCLAANWWPERPSRKSLSRRLFGPPSCPIPPNGTNKAERPLKNTASFFPKGGNPSPLPHLLQTPLRCYFVISHPITGGEQLSFRLGLSALGSVSGCNCFCGLIKQPVPFLFPRSSATVIMIPPS